MNNMKTGTERRTIVLKASAGTGKTYRLSLEYIASLIKGISYRNIAAMTFTRKATAEIKDRIYDFLYQIAFEKNSYMDLEESLNEVCGISAHIIDRQKLQQIYFEMIRNKEEIRISTIDGFTNKIFKNAIAPYFGIYGYEVLEEEEEGFYGEILTEILSNEEYFSQFSFIIDEIKERKNINTYISLIKEMADMRKDVILAEGCESVKEKKLKGDFVRDIEDVFSIIASIGEQRKEDFYNILTKDFRLLYERFREIESHVEGPDMESVYKSTSEKIEEALSNWELLLKKNIWNGNKVKGKNFEGMAEELKEKMERIREDITGYIFHKKILPLHERLVNVVKMTGEISERKKIALRRFTYDDILVYTYKFIYNEDLRFINDGKVKEDFLELIGGKIDTIMIDEFQDTSILQWKILELLLKSAENVICVGDEKQSIYSWRGGEKELFANLENIIPSYVEELERSYRSYREVIENVNSIFKGYNKDWSYNEVKYRNEEEYQRGYFSYYIKERKYTYKSNEEQPEYAFEEMIRMIRNEEVRNLGRSCIICRTNSVLKEITDRLNEERIPYTLTSNAPLLEHKAVKPLYRLIKYFVYGNYGYFLEFMRSDLIGCLNDHVKYLLENKDKIEEYFLSPKERSFTGYVEENQSNEAGNSLLEYKGIDIMSRNDLVFSHILTKVADLKEMSRKMKDRNIAGDFAERIVSDFNTADFFSTNSDLKNIFSFFNILKGYDDLFEFVCYVEEEGGRIRQLSSSDIDAINLMTIHKSKGLEFDTVFYYKRERKSEERGKSLLALTDYDEEFGKVKSFLLTLKKYSKVFTEGQYAEIIEKNKMKEEMEAINADYVAITRAKKNIVLFLEGIRTEKEGIKDRLVRRLINVYGEEGEYRKGELIESEKKASVLEDVVENIGFDEIMPYFKRERIKEVSAEGKIDLSLELKRKMGLAIHYYFEHITNDISRDRKAAASALLSRYGNMLGKGIIKDLLARMDKFIAENKEIYHSRYRSYNELEIYDKDGHKRIIDRVNIDEQNRKIYIYDYKTGYEPMENEKYIQQLEEYKEILAEKTEGEYEIFTRILEIPTFF